MFITSVSKEPSPTRLSPSSRVEAADQQTHFPSIPSPFSAASQPDPPHARPPTILPPYFTPSSPYFLYTSSISCWNLAMVALRATVPLTLRSKGFVGEAKMMCVAETWPLAGATALMGVMEVV
jgi:hypothetical protein